MAATSIHLKPCKLSSERHNLRLTDLPHVRKELTSRNEWWSAVSDLSTLRKEIKNLVKEKTGRTMQKKAVPLYEGVVVIKEDTSLEQLKEIGRQFHELWGITLVQASIQRDEGRWVDSEGKTIKTKPNEAPAQGEIWMPNFHAHLVFDYYNHETGKSCKVPRHVGAQEMQTICARVLGMERGVSSTKKHLDAMAYKAHAAQQEMKELQHQAETLQEDIDELSVAKARKEEAISSIQELGTKTRDWISGRGKRERQLQEEKIAQLSKDLKTAEEENARHLETDHTLAEVRKRLEIAEKESETLRKATQELSKTRQQLPAVWPEAYGMGIQIEQAIDLAAGKPIRVALQEKNIIQTKKKSVWLRWNKRIEVYSAKGWMAFKEWVLRPLNRTPEEKSIRKIGL